MLRICEELDLPSCQVMRRLLEGLGLPPNKVTDVLKQPDLVELLASQPNSGNSRNASRGGSTAGTAREAAAATQLPSQHHEWSPAALLRLQQDIARCCEADAVCSPASDLARHHAGLQYEELLQCELAEAGIPYWTEEALRAKGFYKTPDAKLEVPVAVRGQVVNWVDSKATFGDDRTHRCVHLQAHACVHRATDPTFFKWLRLRFSTFIRHAPTFFPLICRCRHQSLEQYQGYVNRFGAGLVIYWHGYIADLAGEGEGDSVLIMDRFPRADELIKLPCLPLSPLPQEGRSLLLVTDGAAAASVAAERAAEG